MNSAAGVVPDIGADENNLNAGLIGQLGQGRRQWSGGDI